MSRARDLLATLRRRHAVAAAVFLPVAAGTFFAAAQTAAARCCTLPSGGSPNATAIATLYDIILGLGIAVFLIVFGFIAYSVWKFRASKHPVAAQFHGNTRLELSLTAAATMLLVVIAAATFIALPTIIDPPNSNANIGSVLSASLTAPVPPNGKEVTICVMGRQYIWRYTYGANCNKTAWQDRLPYS